MEALKLVEPPTKEAAAEAAEAVKTLAHVKGRGRSTTVRVRPGDGAAQEAIVPRQAYDLFLEVLRQMSQGNAVTIVPIHAELTTQQAADLLNVSRPYLVELLTEGKIPFRMVGTRRRVRYADLLTYQRVDDAKRRSALDELTREAESLNLGY
jgi:excisionase family DNA binding protein